MNTRSTFFLALATAILGFLWQRSLTELSKKDAQLQKQAKELQQLQQQLAVANATTDMLAKRLAVNSQTALGKITNEIEAAERRQRIPAGATDPDKMWKGQMKAAQDVIRASGMPATR